MSSPLLFAAVSGLLLGASSPMHTAGGAADGSAQAAFSADGNGVRTDADAGDKHACKGQNACKGQGGCKTMSAPKDKNGCSGPNGCGSK